MLQSWLSMPPESPFSLANIPFGIISTASDGIPRPAVAIGDYALDLKAFTQADGFASLAEFKPHTHSLLQITLNDFAALGRPVHSAVRSYIQAVFKADTPYPTILKENKALQDTALLPLSQIKNHLPMKIGDYTDFYAGLNHAFNVGVLFRGVDNALQPNYKHLPVGYHGRASSVVVSGTPIHRPRGQILPPPAPGSGPSKVPMYSPCRKLDYELELAAFVSTSNPLGHPVTAKDAESHIFGLVLMNDWSARDIQAWEYVPLGPFNSKNFGTTISPWIVLLDALEPFRTKGMGVTTEPPSNETLLPYLQEARPDTAYDMKLQIEIKPSGAQSGTVISNTNASKLLYSFPQMVAHHTVTGCNFNPGDLLGSGTISGEQSNTTGSLLEMTKNGKEPLPIKKADGSDKFFIDDGDEIFMTGMCGESGSLVGFGECRGVILPALE